MSGWGVAAIAVGTIVIIGGFCVMYVENDQSDEIQYLRSHLDQCKQEVKRDEDIIASGEG